MELSANPWNHHQAVTTFPNLIKSFPCLSQLCPATHYWSTLGDETDAWRDNRPLQESQTSGRPLINLFPEDMKSVALANPFTFECLYTCKQRPVRIKTLLLCFPNPIIVNLSPLSLSLCAVCVPKDDFRPSHTFWCDVVTQGRLLGQCFFNKESWLNGNNLKLRKLNKTRIY